MDYVVLSSERKIGEGQFESGKAFYTYNKWNPGTGQESYSKDIDL